MNVGEIENVLKEIIVYRLGADWDEITPNLSFVDLLADSMDLIEITLDVERMFGIDVPEEDEQNLIDLGSWTEYVDRKLLSQGCPGPICITR